MLHTLIIRSGVYYIDEPTVGLKVRKQTRIPPEEIKNYTRKKKRWHKDVLFAQLKLYDIDVKNDEKVDKMDDMLRAAIKAKKCVKIPERLVRLEQQLRTEYNIKYPAHQRAKEKEARRLDEEERREAAESAAQYAAQIQVKQKEYEKRQKELEQLDTLAAQAEYDVQLFLRKHFMHREGRNSLDPEWGWDRDENKHEALLIGSLSEKTFEDLLEGAKEIELPIVIVQKSTSKSLCMGWDRVTVYKKANPKCTEEEVQDHVDLNGNKRQRALARHRMFVRQQAQPTRDVMRLQDAIGSYTIRCKDLEGSEYDPDYTMNIFQDVDHGYGLVAQFNFELYEGTMLLAQSQENLQRLRLAHRNEESEIESDPSGDEREFEQRYGSGKILGGLAKQLAPSLGTQDRSPKRLKLAMPEGTKGRLPGTRTTLGDSSSSSRASGKERHQRLYFEWRGRETGEGQIQVGYGNSNIGYMEFADNTCSKFVGKISFECYGENLHFEGFKIASRPAGTIKERWEDLCEWQHGAEQVGRWGGRIWPRWS